MWNLGTIDAGDTKIVTVNATVVNTLIGGSSLPLTGRISGANLGGFIGFQDTTRSKKAP